MKIQVIPSVDILNGKVVRLFQGQYNKVTEYTQTPFEAVNSFIKHGFGLVHVVNLDGAKSLHNEATENAIEEILTLDCKIQIGGGIRSLDRAKKYANLGARVVLGTVCVKSPSLTHEIIANIGEENTILAFDCKDNGHGNYEVMVNGWCEGNKTFLEEMLKFYSKYKISILCTDISVDGTLTSPNFALYRWIKSHFPQYSLQASGGISCIEDIVKLQEDKIHSVIVGRAIHSGLISMQELAKIS